MGIGKHLCESRHDIQEWSPEVSSQVHFDQKVSPSRGSRDRGGETADANTPRTHIALP